MSSLSTEWASKLERELLASHSDAFDDMIRLLTRDKEIFRIPKYVVLMSNLISWKILYQPDLSYYNLPNITGHILSLVLEFCHYHTKKRPANHEKQTAAFIEVEKPMTKGPHLKKYVEKWDQNFIKHRTQEELLHLYYASHYLDIKPLCEIVMVHVAVKYVKATQVPSNTNRAGNFRNDFGVGERVNPTLVKEYGHSAARYHDPFAPVQRDEWKRENVWLSATQFPDTAPPLLDGVETEPSISLTLESFDSKKVVLDMIIVQQRLSDLFQEFDVDGDRTITHDEFFNMLQAVQTRGKIEQQDHFDDKEGAIFTSIVEILDTDNDGNIDEGEFISWCVRGLQLQPHERIAYSQQNEFSRKLGNFLMGVERVVTIEEHEAKEDEDPYHREYHLPPIGASGNESDSMGEISDKSGSGEGASSGTGTSQDEAGESATDGEGQGRSKPRRVSEDAAEEAAGWSMDFPILISTENGPGGLSGRFLKESSAEPGESKRSPRKTRRRWLSGSEKIAADEGGSGSVMDHSPTTEGEFKTLVDEFSPHEDDEEGTGSGSATDYSHSGGEFKTLVDEFDGELVLYSDTSYSANSDAMDSSSAGEDAANGNEDEKDASVVDYRSERQKERERIRRSEN